MSLVAVDGTELEEELIVWRNVLLASNYRKEIRYDVWINEAHMHAHKFTIQ